MHLRDDPRDTLCLVIRVMAKTTSKNGGSKRSSKAREPSEQVRAQATLNALIHIHLHATSEI